MKKTAEVEQRNQTLTDHLTELRSRLVKSLWCILLGMVACYNFSGQLFDFIRQPIAPYLQGGGLIFTAPADKFIAYLKVSFFAGLILTFPLWFYQLYKFVAPGLYAKEKKYTASFILTGTTLFCLGVCFSYFVIMPLAFRFLMNYGSSIDHPMITIDQYLSFFLTMCLMFGLAFELPLIIVILGMLELVSAKFLRTNRRYVIVMLAIVSAIITPPDLLSMTLMFVPLIVLFESSILFVALFERKRIRENGMLPSADIRQ
jgi:sec-independent protein translocase protein TatC